LLLPRVLRRIGFQGRGHETPSLYLQVNQFLTLELVMNARTETTTNTTTQARRLLTWMGLSIAATALAAASAGAAFAQSSSAQASSSKANALMLRPGNWNQESGGGYLLPAALGALPKAWPADGWYRVTQKADGFQVSAVPTPSKGLPDFLYEIAMQVIDPQARVYARPEMEAEVIDTRYIRIPGVALTQGFAPTVKFSRTVLRPMLDHSYALTLGEQAFTLSVQNGQRNKAGVAYGQGAQYTVSYERNGQAESFTYALGAYGNFDAHSTVIQAVTDLDGDGLPDFIVQADGGAQEFLLLSTQAKPGRNAPTAVLAMDMGGC
jgi:hypothetical protein